MIDRRMIGGIIRNGIEVCLRQVLSYFTGRELTLFMKLHRIEIVNRDPDQRIDLENLHENLLAGNEPKVLGSNHHDERRKSRNPNQDLKKNSSEAEHPHHLSPSSPTYPFQKNHERNSWMLTTQRNLQTSKSRRTKRQ